MTTTTETTPATDSGTDNPSPQIPTLPEWIAHKLRSTDIRRRSPPRDQGRSHRDRRKYRPVRSPARSRGRRRLFDGPRAGSEALHESFRDLPRGRQAPQACGPEDACDAPGGAVQRGAAMTRAEERFWAKVDKQSNGCWLWTAYCQPNGYGWFYAGPDISHAAHRFSFELLVGPVSEGLDLDHLCRVRSCVNPAHLEPVTRRENLLRGETVTAMHAAQQFCINDHEFTPANTYVYPDGRRRLCRACRASRMRSYHAARKAS